MAERTIHSGADRDGGFTLIEVLISIVVTGIVAGVLGTAVMVVMKNEGPTQQRFNGANDSMTVTSVFPADVGATPPGGREVGELPSGCAGAGADRGGNVLRLTWTERTGGGPTSYRVSYRLDTVAGELLRTSCTATGGDYGAAAVRIVGTLVSDAELEYSSLDAEDLTLVLTLATTPPSVVRIGGVRMNPAATLPPPPIVNARSAIRVQTTTEALQYADRAAQLTFDTIVLNAGTTYLRDVVVDDPAADDGSVTCEELELPPGEATECTFTHDVTQADLDAGEVTSLTTVTAAPPSGEPISNVAGEVTVPGVQAPQMSATKTTSTSSYRVAGDVIDYEVSVQNTGNVTLTSLEVTDPKSDGAIDCTPVTLAPADVASCSYRYTVGGSDLGIGSSVATAARATATPPGGGTTSASSNTVAVPFQASPAISATKRADRAKFGLVGQTIDYTITVTNTGNVGLSGITVDDPNALIESCAQTSLSPGASLTCMATHLVTPADVADGRVVNQATASGEPASGGPDVTATTNEVTVPYDDGPSLAVTKVYDDAPSSYRSAGDVLEYALTVRNTGPIALADVVVTDPMHDGPSAVCSFATLGVGDERTCTARHTVTAGEVGSPIVNTARAEATSANGDVTVDSNEVTVNYLASPTVDVQMTSSPSGTFTQIGDRIDYTMTVTNTGNVPLSDVGITEQSLAGVDNASCGATSLAVDASTACTSSYTTTANDASGSVSNMATASGTYAPTEVTASSQSVTVSSAVPCAVADITAAPTTIGRRSNDRLLAPVAVSADTTGVCSGLRIQYFPNTSRPGVIDTMTRSGSTWSYTIPDSGGKASKWDPGPARVDVLPATGTAPLNETTIQPFTVT